MLTKEMDLRYRNGEKPRQVVFLESADQYGDAIVSLSANEIHTHQPDGIYLQGYESNLDLLEYDPRREIKKGQMIAVTENSSLDWMFFPFVEIGSKRRVIIKGLSSSPYEYSEWRFLTPEEMGQ
jgi:hypothetical protein